MGVKRSAAGGGTEPNCHKLVGSMLDTRPAALGRTLRLKSAGAGRRSWGRVGGWIVKATLMNATLAAVALVALLGCGTATEVAESVTDSITAATRPPEPEMMTVTNGGSAFIGFTSLEERILNEQFVP